MLNDKQREKLQMKAMSLMETNSTRTSGDRILAVESGGSKFLETSGAIYLLTEHNSYIRLEYFITDYEAARREGLPRELVQRKINN